MCHRRGVNRAADAARGRLPARTIAKDVDPARDLDQLADPGDIGDHRIVPFFEIHSRPARRLRGPFACSGKELGALSDDAGGSIARPAVVGSLPALGLSALGVVFGDIGTSPLYTLKTVLGRTTASNASVTLGVLSLLVWTLIVITTIKYVSVAMSVDNDGEGGILALLSLIGVKRQHRPGIVAIGLFGAALIYGGAITPAISVLSALERLDIATPGFSSYVLPASVVILIALFTVQPQGTRIGRTFGPIIAPTHNQAIGAATIT